MWAQSDYYCKPKRYLWATSDSRNAHLLLKAPKWFTLRDQNLTLLTLWALEYTSPPWWSGCLLESSPGCLLCRQQQTSRYVALTALGATRPPTWQVGEQWEGTLSHTQPTFMGCPLRAKLSGWHPGPLLGLTYSLLPFSTWLHVKVMFPKPANRLSQDI